MEKQYDHQSVEQTMQKLWTDQQTYAVDVHAAALYAIDTPPPTVSGALHIGHIFSYTHTDIFARFWRMHGKEIYYPFGFDDNGLPTERFVEKKCAVSAYALGRTPFINLCLQETIPVEQAFQELWTGMGLSVDWRFCYATIDEKSRRISQVSFLRLLQKGYIYRRDEPAPYCTTCKTTVAQAELDDVEQASVFYDIIFTGPAGVPLKVATTRPELLPATVALLYNPHDVRYAHLAGQEAHVPIFGHTVPIVADDTVIAEKGTGLVMCCTFGDTLDISWYKKHHFTYRPACGRNGKWVAETGILAGLTAKKARETVIEALRSAGLCVAERAIQHTVNVHERCKQNIEYLVLPQWFLKILPYKKELVALADTIAWYPEFMKARYVNWVENLTWDWCLSRQRFFGIPFPVWHCTLCQRIVTPHEDALPIDPQETPWEAPCVDCGGLVVPDTDVMDTWNTSSLTPYICEALRTGDDHVFDRPYTQMSMRPQAHDIIRTWAFYTIVKTWMHHGVAPWKNIVISGHVITASREKISKSQGNSVLEPAQLRARFSADAIRHWTASGMLGHDVAFSEQQLKVGSKLLVKLWNAYRFIEEHTASIQEVSQQMVVSNEINRWMLHQVARAYEQYQNAFMKYEFNAALSAIERCFWQIFCDEYLELIKDQLFNPDQYAAEVVAETRAVLLQVGLRILQMYAPFVPHITEKLYQELYRSRYEAPSLHRMQYADIQHPYEDQQACEIVSLVTDIVGQVRRIKTDHQLSLRSDIAILHIYATALQHDMLKNQEQMLRGITRAQSITWHAPAAEVQPIGEQRDGLFYATVVVTI